jgi:hypothetical protein
LLYGPKNQRRISGLCVPTKEGSINVSEQPFKELTSDKTGHTEKKVVTKSTRNLFSVSRKYAARKIESDVTPL